MRILSAAIMLLSMSATSLVAQNYHVADTWKIGGQGGWDYLVSDDAAHLLYITHNARVEVVDQKTGKTVGAITGLMSTHGVVLDPDGKTGYTSDGAGNAIVIFDRATFAVLAKVPAGMNPDGMTYEPVTKTVWAFNGRSSSVSVLDTASRKVIATIPLPGKPEFPRADGKGSVFANIEDKNEIVKLDATSKQPVATWPLTGCDSPSGLAIDQAKHRLFSVCDGGKMVVSDYVAGKAIGSASIGDGPDAAAFDPKTGYAFSSNGESGTLSVIDTRKAGYPTVQTLTTEKGARTMAFNAATGEIYVVTADTEPAPATASPQPHHRRNVVPDTFRVIVIRP